MNLESAEVFVKLMESDDIEEQSLARHSSATEEVWQDVVDRFPHMKDWVILNKTVPLSILNRLSSDADVGVRMSVALKRKLSHEIFERLSTDESADVRRTLAHNTMVPQNILEKFLNDSDEDVRKAARWRLDISE